MIGRLVRYFNTGGLLRDSTVLFAGMALIHVCSLLFQVVMGRCLIDEEYATLTALLGVFNILMVPLGVISSTVSRYSRILVQDGRTGDVGRLIRYWLKIVVIPGGLLAVYCLCFPYTIATFINLSRPAPIYILGIAVLGVFIRPVVDGALIGLQNFKAWSISSSIGWGCRLLIGVVLVLVVSPSAGWGLLGHGIGYYVSIFLGVLFVLKSVRKEEATSAPLPPMHDYVFRSFIILLSFSCLMTSDVILVKHLLPDSAREFSYSATLGRLVIFVPQALVSSMFPKVVCEHGGNALQLQIFKKTVMMTFLATAFSSIIFYFTAEFLLWFIYGIQHPSSNLVLWSRMLSFTMVPVSLLSVSISFAMAQRKFKAFSILPLAALCYVIAPFVLGADVIKMLITLAVCTLVPLVFGVYQLFRAEKRRRL